jgi:hypothetical protein
MAVPSIRQLETWLSQITILRTTGAGEIRHCELLRLQSFSRIVLFENIRANCRGIEK